MPGILSFLGFRQGYAGLPTNNRYGDQSKLRSVSLWRLIAVVTFVIGLSLGAFLWYEPLGTMHLPALADDPGYHQRPPPPPPPSNGEGVYSDDPTVSARQAVDELFRRQSQTLEQARTRYRLKTKRQPPPGYDSFFKFAREKHCLIDEYDRIHRDFEPFYQLAKRDPEFFKRMVERGMKLASDVDEKHLTTWHVRKDGPQRAHNHWSPFATDWESKLAMVSSVISPMDVIFNLQDEPRVLFNTRLPDAMEHAMQVTDSDAFSHSPKPTGKFFSDPSRHQCLVPNSDVGFGNSTNDVNGFMVYSSSTGFSYDLYPVLSQTKISPCFSDIVIPSSYYYQNSWWSSKYSHPDDIKWSDKKPILYWRGSTTGGSYWGPSYHAYPRFRYLKMVKQHPNLMNGAFTAMKNCGAECPEDAIRQEYGFSDKSPKEDEFQYRFLFDVDGNTFSGRYQGMLRGNSLIFKSTIFTEYFEDWIKPYEHYIPVLPDLSDLVERVQWAIDNDREAYRIQQAGKEFATRVLTDDQNDCYFYLVLLEYSRLFNMASSIRS